MAIEGMRYPNPLPAALPISRCSAFWNGMQKVFEAIKNFFTSSPPPLRFEPCRFEILPNPNPNRKGMLQLIVFENGSQSATFSFDPENKKITLPSGMQVTLRQPGEEGFAGVEEEISWGEGNRSSIKLTDINPSCIEQQIKLRSSCHIFSPQRGEGKNQHEVHVQINASEDLRFPVISIDEKDPLNLEIEISSLDRNQRPCRGWIKTGKLFSWKNGYHTLTIPLEGITKRQQLKLQMFQHEIAHKANQPVLPQARHL